MLADSPNADVVIPPAKNAVITPGANQMIGEIEMGGCLAWQNERNYGFTLIIEFFQLYP